MLTSLKLQNFKVGERRSFAFDDRVSVLEGDIGASKTIALDAFRLLLMASRDDDTAAFPRSWIAEDSPTRLAVSVATYEHPELTYAVTMRRSGARTLVLDERVSDGRSDMLTRAGGYYHAGARSRDRRRIDDTRLAISDAVRYLPDNSPVNDVRRALHELWLIAPDAYRMGSGIAGGDATAADTAFAQLATYIALRAHTSETVRNAMMGYLRQLHSAAITGISVSQDSDGKPCLVVHHQNDLDPAGVPFGSLDNSEKMLFLAAFVCAVNESASPLSVVWDSPGNWLGERGATAILKMLRRSFSLRGQLVMLA